LLSHDNDEGDRVKLRT